MKNLSLLAYKEKMLLYPIPTVQDIAKLISSIHQACDENNSIKLKIIFDETVKKFGRSFGKLCAEFKETTIQNTINNIIINTKNYGLLFEFQDAEVKFNYTPMI